MRIIVYANDACRPCDQVKALLRRAGVDFDVRLVDEDDRAYDELLALGQRSVPVTVIGAAVIVGFDPDALATALAAAG